MPVVEQIENGISSQTPDCPRRWTVEEAAKVAEVFPGERYEVIEGEIITKMGQKPLHARVLHMLTILLARPFGLERIRTQYPIRLPQPEGRYSEPEPDLVLLTGDGRGFVDHHPGPEDISLLIEVSDTSFQLDREIKYRLYARAGISEYWIVDIPKRRILVCREPAGDEYKSITMLEAGEKATSPRAPGFAVSFEELFA